jgi:glyoxylase-like metal-dependent hydrolase (beta-lactamase superfamily II)
VPGSERTGDDTDDTADRRYVVYAIKYGERDARRSEHFHPDFPATPGDPHDDSPMPMDYFVWAVVDGATGRAWVVDTGFDADDAARRGRRLLRTATEGLALVGIDAATVADVIVTHFHYDHIGGLDQFPEARLHVQDREVAFATGRHMNDPSQRGGLTARHVADLVLAVHGGRVVFHDGDAELAPGLWVHHLGGHTDGLQVVRVWTASGWFVVASDAAHYYEHASSGRPFHIVFDIPANIAGFDRVRELAGGDGRWAPGHDPEVLRRFPPAPGLGGIVARLDGGPR